MKTPEHNEAVVERADPRAIKRLLGIVKRDWNRAKTRRKARLWDGYFLVVSTTIMLVGSIVDPDRNFPVSIWPFCLVAWLGIVCTVWWLRTSLRKEKPSYSLSSTEFNEICDASTALARLLDRVGPEDGDRLARSLRTDLCRLLPPCSDPTLAVFYSPELAIATLRALERVGGARELPVVERVAAAEIVHEHQAPIRTAAQRCRAALQERLERERAGKTLLRASVAPGESTAVLLRPAQGTTDADPQQLLRPVETDGNQTH